MCPVGRSYESRFPSRKQNLNIAAKSVQGALTQLGQKPWYRMTTIDLKDHIENVGRLYVRSRLRIWLCFYNTEYF